MWQLGFLLLLLTGVQSSSDVDVQGEVDRIVERLSKLEKPSPIMMESIFSQIQAYCPNSTVDENLVKDMSKCMESKFNTTNLEGDIREAIPAGKLDEVFHDICIKWPVMKGCLKPVIDVIQECWPEGNKVTKVMDNMVHFFCGSDNDGAKIALFFADGGMKCVDTYGDEIKACIMNTNTNVEMVAEANKDDLCRSVKQMHECTHKGLRKCDDSTPENLVTSMLKEVAKSIDCPPILDAPRLTSAATHSFTHHLTYSTIMSMLLVLVNHLS